MKELFYLLALAGGVTLPTLPPKPPIVISRKIELIKFSAKWCGPCVAFAPTYEAYAKKYASKDVVFYSVDIDANPEFMQKYKIESIPTTVILIDGKEVKRISGAFSESELRNVLN